MSVNAQQHAVTTYWAKRFEQELSELIASDASTRLHPLLYKAQIESLESIIEDLHQQMSETEETI